MIIEAKTRKQGKLWIVFLLPLFVFHFAVFVGAFLNNQNLTMGFTAFVCMLIAMLIYQLKTQISTNNFNKHDDY
jgi:hypothetical protein